MTVEEVLNGVDDQKIMDHHEMLEADLKSDSFKEDRGAIMVSVHADDEIYLMASMMFNYPFSIILHTPFLGDMYKGDGYEEQRMMLYKSIYVINKYRLINGFKPVYIGFNGFGYRPDGFLTDESSSEFTVAVGEIERSFNKFDKIDYYIRTCESTHQNHCHANHIANAVLRSPYLDKTDCICQASYPNDFSVGKEWNNTSFQDMNEEQVTMACDILDKIYGWKAQDRSTLSSATFKKMLSFMGSNSNCEYAQTYHVDRHRLYGAKHNIGVK